MPAPKLTTTTAPARDSVAFLGNDRDYWRLMIRGAGLLLCTLGLYRFWLVTDMRRFLWNNVEIGGDSLEYSGTALELLAGFLVAVALLVPLYGALFLAAFDLGPLGHLSGLLAFLLLAYLGQFAVYRARRYRLTRTIYRGIRFRQIGSAWRYAICALVWWAVIIATLGLAYPWALKRLERFKMNNTFYGDLPGRFEGSAFSLLLRGAPLWFVVVGPFVAGLVIAVHGVNWSAALAALRQGGDDAMGRLEGASPGFGAAVVIALLACGWAVLAAAVLYPAFQALVLRWWLAGLRFGALGTSVRLRLSRVYAVYVRFLWYGFLFSLAAAIAGTAVALIYRWVVPATASAAGEATVTVLIVAGYAIAALGYSTIYQTTVRLGFWRLGAESVVLSGTQVLDHVKAVGQPSSPVGEGLADALKVGGW